ncbi:ankyrin repeat domain-containing protein [Myxococcus fulvus]|uniref:ankyrin repeat domain-containing protein n=1 Tax=Myxococcus fulvus TaxID=33 RepID=UPI003B9D2BE7
MPVPRDSRLHSNLFLAGPLGLWLMAHSVSSPLPDRLPESAEDWAAKRCPGGPVRPMGLAMLGLSEQSLTFEEEYPASQLVGCEIHVVRVIEVRAKGATMTQPPQVALAVEETLLGPASPGPLPAVFSQSYSDHLCGNGAIEERAQRKNEPVEGPGLGERFLVLGGWNAARTWFHVSDRGRWKFTPELRARFEERLTVLRRQDDGFDRDARDLRQQDQARRHDTALLAAVKAGDVPGAKALLAQGASALSEKATDWSPLYFAIHRQDAEMTRLLMTAIPRGAPDGGAMDEAIRLKDAGLVRELLAAGVKLEHRSGVNGPLHAALQDRSCAVLRVLLEHGVDPNIPGQDSKYPLHEAAGSVLGQPCVPLLLEHGARPDPETAVKHSTPLEYLAHRDHSPQAEAAVRALVAAGARVKRVKLKTIKDGLMRAVFEELGAR